VKRERQGRNLHFARFFFVFVLQHASSAEFELFAGNCSWFAVGVSVAGHVATMLPPNGTGPLAMPPPLWVTGLPQV